MFICLLVFIALALATYTDVRSRTIPNVLTYPLIVLGVVLLPLRPVYEIVWALLGVVLSYILYRFGMWAGGDAKLFFALSLLLPRSLFGFPAYLVLFLLSTVVAGIVAAVYVLWRALLERREVFAKIFGLVISAFSLATYVSILGPFGLISVFLPRPLAFFSALAFFLAYVPSDVVFLASLFFLAPFVLYLLSLRSWAFSKDFSVDQLREGDVPTEFITERGERVAVTPTTVALYLLGQIKPVVSPLKAGGLTPPEIEKLRRMSIQRIRVKHTVPFVPFVLVSYTFLMFFTPLCT